MVVLAERFRYRNIGDNTFASYHGGWITGGPFTHRTFARSITSAQILFRRQHAIACEPHVKRLQATQYCNLCDLGLPNDLGLSLGLLVWEGGGGVGWVF